MKTTLDLGLFVIEIRDYLLIGALSALALQTWYVGRGIRLDQKVVLILLFFPMALPVAVAMVLFGFFIGIAGRATRAYQSRR